MTDEIWVKQMTGKEWIKSMGEELTEKGYTFEYYGGLPMVQNSAVSSFADKMKFLREEFKTPCTRKIYAEGVLFVPPGMEIEKS